MPETKSRVGVQFTLFKIFGLLPIKAPESAKGNLDTTFVDEELRISRGDKGRLNELTLTIYKQLEKLHVTVPSIANTTR